ncbi:MAG TPA: ATP-grasp domain-containing protein [Vicinamibacterales bacterium]|nr:ATP-grasp domain-containing protein [Vicinamibacterales bacterium]
MTRDASVVPDERQRTIVLLATTTGYQIRSFGEAARALGVRLVIASDRCDHLDDPWHDDAIPIRFQDPEGSAQRVLDALGDPPAGVIAVGDRPTVLAAHLAARAGLPGNPPDAADRSRNKLAARQAWRSAGLLTPAFDIVPSGSDAESIATAASYPAVVKPLALSGSRGVIRVDTPDECRAALDRVRRLLHADDIRGERDAVHEVMLIESFIPGCEFAVEGVLTNGVFTPFAIFDKPDPLDGPFFEETIYVTPSRAAASVQQLIVETVSEAALALGLRHGPVHAECRVNDRGVFVLEVAARPIGGLCSRALRFGDDASLEEVLLRHAAGEDVRGIQRETAASGVMMIPIPARGVFRGVDGVEAARAVSLINDVKITAKQDALLLPLPEGRSYLGFIFARGDTAMAVERALREAHARLHFTIERELAVLP